MRRSLLPVLGLAFGCIIFDLCGARNHFLHAQQTSYYEGKTVRLVVGSSPGGGYDYWARILARYLPKYLSGNPAFVVQKLPGGGSFMSANSLHALANTYS